MDWTHWCSVPNREISTHVGLHDPAGELITLHRRMGIDRHGTRNYGCLTSEQTLRSLRLFAEEVMPACQRIE